MKLGKDFCAPAKGRDFVDMTKSSGCILCDLNLEPIKLRRNWVHHLPKRGKLIFCNARNLKPAA